MKRNILADQIRSLYGSQSKFAAAAGLNASTVSAIVNGRLDPYPSQRQKIVDALGWQGDPDELFLDYPRHRWTPGEYAQLVPDAPQCDDRW